MLQKIAAICAIISCLLAIYTTFANKPGWQRYALFTFALICFIVLVAERKHKLRKPDGVKTLTGTQAVAYQYSGVEAEVFYPNPFKHTPNLTIRFPEQKKTPHGRRAPDVGYPEPPTYEITEQRSDGFKIKVLSLGHYEPVIKWQAEGLIKDQDL